jgi:dipeptidyl-peptidase-4
VILQFEWGEATDEPPAREDARPTEIANRTTTEIDMKILTPRWLLVVAFLLSSIAGAPAQDMRTNAGPRIFRDRVEPHWFAGASGETNQFWYRRDLPQGQREFILVDAPAGQRKPAFDHARLAKALSEKSGKTVEAERLPIDSLECDRDGKTVALRVSGAGWTLDLESYSLTVKTDVSMEEHLLPVGRIPRPSQNTGAETDITFINRLAEEVEIFWSDTDGKRISYGMLRPGETRPQHTFAGHVWVVCARNGNVLAVFEAEQSTGTAVVGGQDNAAPRQRRNVPRAETRSARSPDGNWEAVVHGDNLFLRDTKTGKEQALTYDGNPNSSYARNAQWDRLVDMTYDARDPETPTPEVYWSPDSRKLVAMRLQPGTQRRVYLVESSPADQLQPKLDSYPYLKPGDEVPIRKPHLFDVEAKKEIPVDDALFSNPWSIGDVRWNTNSSRFTFIFNQRGHQALRILAVDVGTSAVKPIVDEQSKTFICYSAKFFSEYLDDTAEIIWMSERDGWNHLYLYDAKTGAVKNQITKGEWVVRSVDRVDKEKRQIWFQAGGIRPGQDPYYLHYCRVNFDGSGLTILTEGNGTHSEQFSPDRQFFIDTYSRADAPPANELRRSDDGKLVCKLEEADATEVFDKGWQFPEPFAAKGRDGVTDIYGVIWQPRNFDPNKKYPVIECIYAGPQDSFAPKPFRASSQQQTLADLGFIIVQMDGMGTSNRSKKFHDVCWKNLADAGFRDRILWIKAAAAKYSYFDLTRVGLYGTSAGGQNALRGLVDHGDFYRAGMADSGCHDNRMDKIWWNEQWFGWPVDETYVRSSNVTDAHKLQGKLLLMVGEMDKNVDPSSTMQVVNALIKADKDFELLDMPGAGHGVARTPYGARRLQDFFVRNFLGTK